VGIQELSDLHQDVAELLGRGLVANADHREQSHTVSLGEVLELQVRELRIRDRYHRAVEGAHACRADPDLFHRADLVAEPAELAHAHRAVSVERHPSEQILDRLLCREGHGDSAHAQTCNQRGDAEAEAVEDRHEGEYEDDSLHHLPARWHCSCGRTLTAFYEALLDSPGQHVDGAKQKPGRGHDEDGAEQSRHELQDFQFEPERQQCSAKDHDRHDQADGACGSVDQGVVDRRVRTSRQGP
jgi:hypothetical protein